MTCPDLPLVLDAWNLWMVQSVGSIDAGDVSDWIEGLFGDLDSTGAHDVEVRRVEPDEILDPENVERTLWRRTDCDPLPSLADDRPFRMWGIQFVVRGADQPMPGELATKSRDIGPEFVFLVRADRRERDVPDEPPGFFDRLGKQIEKGIDEAKTFYGVLAIVAVVVAVKVIGSGARRRA